MSLRWPGPPLRKTGSRDISTYRSRSCVNGQLDLRVGGRVFSLLADSGFPGGRTVDLRVWHRAGGRRRCWVRGGGLKGWDGWTDGTVTSVPGVGVAPRGMEGRSSGPAPGVAWGVGACLAGWRWRSPGADGCGGCVGGDQRDEEGQQGDAGHGLVLRAMTPAPARASSRRTEGPSVATRWAWCNRRSTAAVAMDLGMMVSKPEGWMLEVTATERRS